MMLEDISFTWLTNYNMGYGWGIIKYIVVKVKGTIKVIR